MTVVKLNMNQSVYLAREDLRTILSGLRLRRKQTI